MINQSTSVFEVYAHEYDLITNAAQREESHAGEVASIVERFQPSRVLDAGCATGLTTLLFARQGVETTGLDRSARMLEVARRLRQPEGLPISYREGSFEKLPKALHRRFDLVVCLANSISGVGSTENLHLSIANFFEVLRPGGHLVLQMLNYSAVKDHVLLPIKVTAHDGIVYERFSERQGKRLFIYVTRADLNQSPPKFEVFRHQFDNFSPAQVITAIRKAGFGQVHRFADLQFAEKFGPHARDLVVTVRRPV